MTPPSEASQEEQMRRLLVSQGYIQRYGVTDTEIRRNLGIRGKCADFVGYHPQRGVCLIAESKGGNLYWAEAQLESTLHGLLAVEPEAIEAIELRLYISTYQHTRLPLDEPGGYTIREGFLGSRDEDRMFHFTAIEGIRVKVEAASVL